MLVSMAIAPTLLTHNFSSSEARNRALLSIFAAIADNGVIVTHSRSDLRSSLVSLATGLNGPLSQRVITYATDIAKNLKAYSVEVEKISSHNELPDDFVAGILWSRCDAVIVPDGSAQDELVSHGICADQIINASKLLDSEFEQVRRRWQKPQRLDEMSIRDAKHVLESTVRYAKSLAVFDKMIGIKTKGGKDTPFHRAKSIEPFMLGVKCLVDAWSSRSPYSGSQHLEVTIVTVAGATSARGGYINPPDVRLAIEDAWAELGIDKSVAKLSIELKKDRTPGIFNYRFIKAMGRVWALEHGVDDLGNLFATGDRRPTVINPNSDAHASICSDLLNLDPA